MPVFQTLINHNKLFSHLTEPPVIINDLINVSEDDRENIKGIITTRYSSDMISLLPSCRCGMTKGEFSSGIKCNYCNTVVKSTIENEIEPNVWFRCPTGVTKLINPIIWIMLKRIFKKSSFSIVQWLTDTTYRAQVKQPPVVNRLVEAGIQRGYNNFVENFDLITNYLFSLSEFKNKKDEIEALKAIIQKDRDAVFSDYLPLPNKALLIVEKTNVGIYVDSIIIAAIDAIEMLVSIDTTFHDQNPRVKENRTAKAISKLSDFYEMFFKLNLSPKTGQFRKHIFGSRTNFSFRAVISSITDTHSYDEIHVPWGIAITVFRHHLVNKLLRLGMSLNSAIGLILGHVEKYNPLLDKLLDELLAEAPGGYIYVILQRNPSLKQGSAQRVRITKFKKDPNDKTVSMSILIVKPMNADFDGDALNLSLALDKVTADSWYPLEPKFSLLELNNPFAVSSAAFIPKPNIISISNWLER